MHSIYIVLTFSSRKPFPFCLSSGQAKLKSLNLTLRDEVEKARQELKNLENQARPVQPIRRFWGCFWLVSRLAVCKSKSLHSMSCSLWDLSLKPDWPAEGPDKRLRVDLPMNEVVRRRDVKTTRLTREHEHRELKCFEAFE